MRWLAAAIVMVAALLGMRGTAAHAAHGDPAARLEALGAALNAGDVDAAVAMFAEDGVVRPVTQGGEPFVGREAIRRWAGILVAGHFHVEFDGVPTVAGPRVLWQSRLWLDQYRDLGVAPAVVIVEVEVEDDRVKTFSSTVSPGTLAQLDAAERAHDTVLQFFATLNAGDRDAVIAALADDIEVTSELGERVRGIAEVRRQIDRLPLGKVELRLSSGPYVAGDRVMVAYDVVDAGLLGTGAPFAGIFALVYVRDGLIRAIVSLPAPGGFRLPSP